MNTFETGVPTAHITINRNRPKTYGDKIYFKNNTHFEIELFNPLQNRVLVKIDIDGRTISSTGIIINPGQRAYLERWIDDSKKFLFNTYEVENSAEARAAIQQNGKVKISFYTEISNVFWTNTYYYNPWPYNNPPVYYNTYYYDPNVIYGGTTIGCSGVAGPSGVKGTCGDQGESGKSLFSGNLRCSTSDANFLNNASMDSIETGRTEMGASSNQQFGVSSGNFNSWPTKVWEWQLLPESLLPVEISKIKQYCPGCRNRIRKETWKFCPVCGEKL